MKNIMLQTRNKPVFLYEKFSDKTEILKSKLFDCVTLENESKINKHVGSNKCMYTGKKVSKT